MVGAGVVGAGVAVGLGVGVGVGLGVVAVDVVVDPHVAVDVVPHRRRWLHGQSKLSEQVEEPSPVIEEPRQHCGVAAFNEDRSVQVMQAASAEVIPSRTQIGGLLF